MNEFLSAKPREYLLSVMYGVILGAACAFGMLLSFGAQRGGIDQFSALFAPILGPWSYMLSPNAHDMSAWKPEFTVFALCLAVVLAASVAGSYFARTRGLRWVSVGVSVPALVLWVLTGLSKVALEMA